MKRPLHKPHSLRAFTMLEMMIAIALVGMLIIGLNFFVFSMGELWGRSSDKRLFEQHVRAVSRYLEAELRQAGLPPHATKNTAAFIPQEIHPSAGLTEILLTFDLPEGSRLVAWPERPLPELVCSFQVRQGKGLYLLWHSRLEVRFEEDSPREVLITPFVTAMAYDYYDVDAKTWSTERSPKKDSSSGEYLAPQRLRLSFAHGGYTQEITLPLPYAAEGLPNF